MRSCCGLDAGAGTGVVNSGGICVFCCSMSGAEDHQGGVHTADFDFYWMWSFLLCLDSHLHFVLGSSVRKAWTPVAFSVFSSWYLTSEPFSQCPLSPWGDAGVWGEVGAALCSVVVVGWSGAQPWLFLWRCSLICAHTWVSVARLLSIANDVYYKSCSARISFYKINGARTISLVANPSVSLGKHKALPCEHGSGSLHLPLLAVPWSCGQGLSSSIQKCPQHQVLAQQGCPLPLGLSSLQ